jgi:hypothetical protein
MGSTEFYRSRKWRRRLQQGRLCRIQLKKGDTKVKQYLVAKMVSGLKSNVELIPMPGLYTLGAAEEFISKAMVAEPQATYVIQEVGAA